jgi:hypothetical protein
VAFNIEAKSREAVNAARVAASGPGRRFQSYALIRTYLQPPGPHLKWEIVKISFPPDARTSPFEKTELQPIESIPRIVLAAEKYP